MTINVKAYLDNVGAYSPRAAKQALMLIAGAALWSVTAMVHAQIPLGNIAKISAGTDTNCAITNGSNNVQCWGNNHYTVDAANPNTGMTVALDAPNAGTTVAEVVVGSNHACSRTNAGAVKCWGQNSYGQLGDGTTIGHPHSAVNVSGLGTGVTAITAGLDHLCALTDAGAVKCWGRNQNGQLGNNSTTDSLVPVTVTGLEQGVVAVAARGNHSCAVLSVGSVQCWGSNSLNELGNGTFTQSSVPVEVPYLGGVSKIAAGDNHNCALIFDGSVKCWGANDSGQSGSVVGLPYILTPIGVQNLSNVVDVSASGKRTCALSITGPLMYGGAVKCWGSNLDSTGAQGANTAPYSESVVDVPGWGSGITAIAAGSYHTCALSTNGNVSCYGWNQLGQLGNNSTTESLAPVAAMQSFKPVQGIISTASNQAVVRFTPPSNDSGSSVTGYTVTTSPAGGVDNQAGTTNSYYGPNEFSHLITGLVNGTTYNFSVVATNALGSGMSAALGSARPTAVNCNMGTVVRGGTYSGTFTAADCTDSTWGDASYTRRYVYNGSAGDQIALQMYVGGRLYLLGREGISAVSPQRLPGMPDTYYALAYSGTYVIEVSPYQVGQTGNYSFAVLAPGIGSSTSSSSSRPSSSSSSAATSSVIASTSTSRSSSSAIASSTSTSVVTSSSSPAVSTSSIASSSSSSSSINNCGAPVISIGSTYNGALSASDCTSGTRGAAYYTDNYAFSGSAGQQIFVQVNSSVFDTYLYLRYLGGAVLTSNDDSGGTTNSRIPVTSGYFTLPTTGAYLIEVSSYASLNTGAYTLSLFAGSSSSSSSSSVSSSSSSASSVAGGCSTNSIAFGVLNGSLATTDCTNGARGASYYTDRYSFTAAAGQQISILLTSAVFDTYVYLKNSSGTVLTSNDDGGGGTNSRIPATSGTYTISTAGTYIIEVTSYATQNTGVYTLQLN